MLYILRPKLPDPIKEKKEETVRLTENEMHGYSHREDLVMSFSIYLFYFLVVSRVSLQVLLFSYIRQMRIMLWILIVYNMK